MKTSSYSKLWFSFMKAAALLLGTISTFIVSPPLSDFNDQYDLKPLLRFLIAGILALLFIVMQKTSANRYHRRWLNFSIAAFTTGLLTGATYILLYNRWSVTVYDKRLTIGSQLYPDAARAFAGLPAKLAKPHVDYADLIKTRACNTGSVWPVEEITSHYWMMALLYSIQIIIWSFFIASIIQAIECYQSKKR
jgi:hypothetical protein